MINKKINVLLVNPPYTKENYYGRLKDLSFVFPPIGLLYLAGYLRKNNINVKIFDFQVSDHDHFKEIIDKENPDIVGITCQTALVYNTIKLSGEIKKILPKTKIIIGGCHPTFRPEDLLKIDDIDMVARGEDEITLKELVSAIESDSDFSGIKGLSYKIENKIIHNPKRELISNIDDFGMPAIDLLPMGKYRVSPDNKTGSRVAVISTSRGCPFECTFCACKMLFDRQYRFRSMESVLEEIDKYIEMYDIDQIFIMDDIFSINKKRTIELCKNLINKGYPKKISIWAQTRVDCIDDEIILWMKKANFKILSFGIESGVQRLLDKIKKGTNLGQIRKAVKLTKKGKIDARGSFILGLPTESVFDSIRTILYALSLPLSQAKFGVATPYPGTVLWDIAKSEGQINEDENWDRFSQMAAYTKHEPPYVPKGRGKFELKLFQKFANFIFYLKPSVIINYIRRVDSWSTFVFYLKSAFKFLKAPS